MRRAERKWCFQKFWRTDDLIGDSRTTITFFFPTSYNLTATHHYYHLNFKENTASYSLDLYGERMSLEEPGEYRKTRNAILLGTPS
jgi:hypothetical protein